nr:MAG TPA: hypothetical protein [Caudoviricetes sp.]
MLIQKLVKYAIWTHHIIQTISMKLTLRHINVKDLILLTLYVIL